MKKFFQIAAFAIVGFISFTSATSMRGFEYFVKDSEIPPTSVNECTVLKIDQQESATGVVRYALYNQTLGRFVRPSDLGSLTIQQYIINNFSVLLCPRVILENQ